MGAGGQAAATPVGATTKLVRTLLSIVAGVLLLWVLYTFATAGVAETIASLIDWAVATLQEIAQKSKVIPDGPA